MGLTENRIKTPGPPVRARARFVRAIILVVSFCFVFFYGFGVGVYRWPPFSVLKASKVAFETISEKYSPPSTSKDAFITVTTTSYSYFALDTTGTLALEKSLPNRAEGTYNFDRTIYPSKTAIIVMDPWIDSPSDHLNEYYGQILDSRIIPLVALTRRRGFPIIVLTNNPKTSGYNSKTSPKLETLVANGEISRFFHQDLDDDGFARYLRSQGVDSLIYTGFASNGCVIGRRTGMIPMLHLGFRIFFIPEASAALELADSWEEQSLHKASTKIISQWIAEIIDYDEFMKALVVE